MTDLKGITLLFDFDMTIGYRILMWTATVKELLLEENVVVDQDRIRPFTHGNGYPWARSELSHSEYFGDKNWKEKGLWWKSTQDFIIEGIISNVICDKEIAIRVANRFKEKYCDLSYWRIFRDSFPVLKRLKERGAEIGILSNHVPEARYIITSLGVMDYVDFAILSAEEEYEKPNIKLFERALQGRDKSKCIMIGDHYDVDVCGALSAGIKAILVRKENTSNYKYYCKDFSTLEEILEKLI